MRPAPGAAASRPGNGSVQGFGRFRYTLRLREPATFQLHHGRVVMALVASALGEHLPEAVAAVACESGRVRMEAGEDYRFGLVFFEGLRDLIEAIPQRLALIGAEASSSGKVLGGNFSLREAVELDPPDIVGAVNQLAGKGSPTLQLVSPLRLKRPKGDDVQGGTYLDRDCFPVAHFLDRLWRRVFLLTNGRYPSADEIGVQCPGCPQEAISCPEQLLWLDAPDKPGTTLGGAVGPVTLEGVPDQWLPTLVAGQYVLAGQGCHRGLGRYFIREIAHPAEDPFRPSCSLLERIADRDVLRQALIHVCRNTESAGVDGVSPTAAEDDAERVSAKLEAALRGGTYRPQPLKGLVLEVEGRKPRPLAVPTVEDRAVQRALCDQLGPAVDTLLEECSYAYRKGFSRAGAAAAIENAYEQGYRWVLDADISSFFDAVEWTRLMTKLEALLPFEPLLDQIRDWIQAPVVFEGQTIERSRGLPQGAVISPLLANLFLDELDEELLDANYRLVRYADDFVVLCKDLVEAQRAADDAKAALERLGLELNPDKTAIRSLDQGFEYLGYLFCRSMVMDARREPSKSAEDAPPPALSWLAQAKLSQPRKLEPDHGTVVIRPMREPEAVSGPPGEMPLYLIGTGTSLAARGEALLVTSADGEERTIPIRDLSHVVALGRTRVTVPVMLRLARFGVPMYFCRRSGELFHVSNPHSPDWGLWMRQAERASDEAWSLAFARTVVAAKIHNQSVLATRLDWGGSRELSGQLSGFEKRVASASDEDTLRGLEGQSSRLLFQCLAANLDQEWGFVARRRRPPPDPVNAMLSFAYSILYHHVGTALVAAGLNPRVGFFHLGRGSHNALASDLVEELRWLAETHIWTMIRRREIRNGDFGPSEDGRHPCLLHRVARRHFVSRFEDRLLTSFTPEGGDTTLTYRAFIDAQARAVRELVSGRVDEYLPLRRRR